MCWENLQQQPLAQQTQWHDDALPVLHLQAWVQVDKYTKFSIFTH
jgi:hypothetical protein